MGKHKKHKTLGWSDWALLGIVLVSTVAIVAALCTWLIDSPREKAEKEMAQLADDYYIEYLYPRLLGMMTAPADSLAKYSEAGVPTTYLRQLLHYDNDKHQDSSAIFMAVECDTNYTGVRYYPVAPYGPRDYTVKYTWNCDDFE